VAAERSLVLPPKRGQYQKWFQKRHLQVLYDVIECSSALCDFVNVGGEFWTEYYRPLLFTSLGKHFAYSMNSTLKLPGWAVLYSGEIAANLSVIIHRKTLKDIAYSPFLPHSTHPTHHPRYVFDLVLWYLMQIVYQAHGWSSSLDWRVSFVSARVFQEGVELQTRGVEIRPTFHWRSSFISCACQEAVASRCASWGANRVSEVSLCEF
jgi:hypothetical protein